MTQMVLCGGDLTQGRKRDRESQAERERERQREGERFGSLCITPISLPCTADQPALNGNH